MHFRKELTDALRTEKYNKIMDTVNTFIKNEEDDTYEIDIEYEIGNNGTAFETYGTEYQLAVSICIKNLPKDRIIEIWDRLFPKHDIVDLLNCWETDGNSNSSHIVWGYDTEVKEFWLHEKVLETKSYDDFEVKMLLDQLTLSELAAINPKIETVIYRPVEIS